MIYFFIIDKSFTLQPLHVCLESIGIAWIFYKQVYRIWRSQWSVDHLL